MSSPSSTARWVLKGTEGLSSLTYEENADVQKVGDEDVLVEMHAASLNYRELVITKGGSGPVTPGIIPSSDGSGVVLAVGSSVSDFKPGDRVVTHLAPFIPDDKWPDFADITAGMGQQVNGTLCEYGVFPQSGLVHMPSNCTFVEAATLTCSALTAWNALFGLHGMGPREGHWVLIQGTGGVSIAALQLSLAAGARVVATTSNDEKAERLRRLGAEQIVNYRTTPEWAAAARASTPNGRGFDIIVDVGGDNTLGQSVKAVRPNGLVIAAGLVAGPAQSERPALLDTIFNLCIVRGVLLATRQQFREMNRFVEKNGLSMALDEEVFALKEVDKAYERLQVQQHFAKVVIKIR